MIFNPIILTQYDGSILGPIARILGMIINTLFNILDKIGIPNIGLSIILFTIIIYLILTPLTFKEQKFSKLSAVMQPEIKAVQDKYKGKNDNESMQKMQNEMQAVYKKYGVNPAGSCVQLLIQMPILFALYRVINNMPAYITKVYDSLYPLAESILNIEGGSDIVKNLKTATKYFASDKIDYTQANTIIDVLNRASSDEWLQIKTALPQIGEVLDKAQASFLAYNKFGWINIADTPQFIFSTGWNEKNALLIIGALLVPGLAAFSQWLNTLLMPQAAKGDDKDNPMAASMKSMNVMMPIMSAVFCFTFPAGMGIYWIASAVVRGIQQVVINKYFDRIGLDKIIEENMVRAKKKEEKAKKITEAENKPKISSKDFRNIRNLPSPVDSDPDKSEEKKTYKKGSLAEKAFIVKRLNEDK